MRLRNTDLNHDWLFGHGKLDYLQYQKSILKDITMRLKEWLQDCFFALQKGIPWSVRLGYHNQKELLDNDIQNVVLGTSGVLNLTDFESIILNRRYRATMNIYTAYTGAGVPYTFETELG